MKYSTWEAISKRHAWYRQVLARRMDALPAERIAASEDFDEIAAFAELADRALRHRERMQRHVDRGMELMPVEGAMQ